MTAVTTRQQRRREQTAAEIVAAAWDLCRAEGLASLSLRELAARVGMRAPSLYSYFDSKNAIYDAMFEDGYRQALAATDDELLDGPVTRNRLLRGLHGFVDFCTSDHVRYQLLFQRTIPGFEPSAASYAVALEYLGQLEETFRSAGIDDPAAMDMCTALLTGLTSQQIANDPAGDRWIRLVDDAVDMFLARYAPDLLEG